MKYTVELVHEPEHWSPICQATIPERWIASTIAITYGGNSILNGEPYPIIGNTRQEVIDLVVQELKNRGLHGTLKVKE